MNIRLISSAALPTEHGDFTVHVFADDQDKEYIALSRGDTSGPVLARIHSGCVTGDIFGSLRCDCHSQLNIAMRKIAQAGAGLLIYLRDHEGRGIGLANKIRAYALQDQGMDTVAANEALGFQADQRDYEAAAAIFKYFGAKHIRLLTNNPRKIDALKAHGLEPVERVPLWTADNPHNNAYLDTKRHKLGHWRD